MSHFLNAKHLATRQLATPRAFVYARLVNKRTLRIGMPEAESVPVGVLKSDAELVLLPEDVKVLDDTGLQVKPSRGANFYVTVTSIDPWHALLEAREENFQ